MESWPTYAAAIRRHHRRITTPDDRTLLQAAQVLPLTGGATGAVYTLARNGTPYCLKIYDADAPQAARREWDAYGGPKSQDSKMRVFEVEASPFSRPSAPH